MSKSVKMWVSLLLIVLASYTLYSMVRVSAKLDGKNPPQDLSDSSREDNAQKPVDLDAFEMTSQQAERFPFKDLQGKVWIASLFFSSCPHECKSLNTAIAALNRDPDFKDVQFVSISVDPDVDSPQTLAEYAELFDADPEQWLFLTGDLQQVGRFGRAIDVPAGYKTHTRRLVLFDRDGKPRGHFRYNDAGDIARLKAAVPEILTEQATGETSPPQQGEHAVPKDDPAGEDQAT